MTGKISCNKVLVNEPGINKNVTHYSVLAVKVKSDGDIKTMLKRLCEHEFREFR